MKLSLTFSVIMQISCEHAVSNLCSTVTPVSCGDPSPKVQIYSFIVPSESLEELASKVIVSPIEMLVAFVDITAFGILFSY